MHDGMLPWVLFIPETSFLRRLAPIGRQYESYPRTIASVADSTSFYSLKKFPGQLSLAPVYPVSQKLYPLRAPFYSRPQKRFA